MTLTLYPLARSSGTNLPPIYPEAPVTNIFPIPANGADGKSWQKSSSRNCKDEM